MKRDSNWEREEREKWLQAQREAEEIEAGSFICPLCQKYVDPVQWWTHIEANPYDSESGFGPTLFHKGCGATVPEKNTGWVKALRRLFSSLPIKPGDYVRLRESFPDPAKPGPVYRVTDIRTDEYAGITEDNPLYVLGYREIGRKRGIPLAQRDDLELVGRPYLKQHGPA